jgi:EAL domain-containing protein (putative c-di-GMP-specific phosphodiesterase class I)
MRDVRGRADADRSGSTSSPQPWAGGRHGGAAGWRRIRNSAQRRSTAIPGHPFRVGVNLAPSQFSADELPKAVQSILQETGLRPDLLELEAIENILLDDDELALSIFQRIQALGVHIASDIRTG